MMYRGTIVEPLPNHRAWVRVPSLAGQDPLDVPVVPYDLLPGEGVLVGDLGARGLDLVVIGREIEGQRFPEWGEIVGVPEEFPPAPHGHTWGDVSGKPASYPPSAHGHAWGEISGKPATYPPDAHSHTWDSVTGKPATFTPSAHTHPATGISDSTATGRAVLTAADAAAARGAIGAGTSSLVLGTTPTTAMRGDKTYTKADVGLGNVDDTSDAGKVASGPIADALAAKAAASTVATMQTELDTHDVGAWVTLALTSPWVGYTGGGNYYSGLRARRKGRSVQIQGMVKSGAVPSTIATLPSDLTPLYTCLKLVVVGTTATPRSVGYIVIGGKGSGGTGTGSITYDSGLTAPTFVSIDVTLPLSDA